MLLKYDYFELFDPFAVLVVLYKKNYFIKKIIGKINRKLL